MEDDEIILDECNGIVLNSDLEQKISNAIDSQFILHLTNVLFGGLFVVNLDQQGPSDKEMAAVGSASVFLHVAFNSLPFEHNLTTLTYKIGLVAVLWKFMKLSHETNRWPALSEYSAHCQMILLAGCCLWLFFAPYTSLVSYSIYSTPSTFCCCLNQIINEQITSAFSITTFHLFHLKLS